MTRVGWVARSLQQYLGRKRTLAVSPAGASLGLWSVADGLPGPDLASSRDRSRSQARCARRLNRIDAWRADGRFVSRRIRSTNTSWTCFRVPLDLVDSAERFQALLLIRFVSSGKLVRYAISRPSGPAAEVRDRIDAAVARRSWPTGHDRRRDEDARPRCGAGRDRMPGSATSVRIGCRKRCRRWTRSARGAVASHRPSAAQQGEGPPAFDLAAFARQRAAGRCGERARSGITARPVERRWCR